MKILYVARHGSGDNQDEEAIAHALTVLGHEVVPVHEMRRHRQQPLTAVNADFCLFHKWPTVSEVAETSKRMPCVFWYFDMVRSVTNDPTLAARSQSRIAWMRDVLPHVKLGFCTDGDWVAADESDKLRWLLQGADERVAGYGDANKADPATPDILFAGMVHHGRDRANHVAHLEQKWGNRFGVMGDGGPRHRLHGRALADVFAATKIVIAPAGPNTDRYWSNRVYLTTSLGGFLLHPLCQGLADRYGDALCFYRSWEECDALIARYLDSDCVGRESLRRVGHQRTMQEHTYRHRCEALLKEVRKCLNL